MAENSKTAWPFADLRPLSYDLIMCDPPWRFETWSLAGKKHKSPEGHYQTMTLEGIKALPVGHLAGGDCVLWLWGTHPMVDQQIEVGRAWGFAFVTSGVWVKRTKHGKLGFGTGYRLRCASEPFLLFTNGNPATAKNIRTVVESLEVIEGPGREHSRKPDEAYAVAEKMLPKARRADLFSRQVRPGWDAWGDQTTKFQQEETAA